MPSGHAVVDITVQTPIGEWITITCLIDTGFDGELGIVEPLISYHGFAQVGEVRMMSATGQVSTEAIYQVLAQTGQGVQELRAVGMARNSIGLGLLKGRRLAALFVPGEEVTIEPQNKTL